MKFTQLEIPDVFLIEPQVFTDERGSFYESFNAKLFCDAIQRDVQFVQDNHSHSSKYVLRGLHYQLPPHAQGKIVRVTKGEVFDVVVDIRSSSPTFGQWVGQILSADNKKQIWVPEGFAHGFLTLTDTAEFLYKTTDHFAAGLDKCIKWNDPDLAIKWPLPTGVAPVLSDKDSAGQFLKEAVKF